MIIAIRIAGRTGLSYDINETLNSLRLQKKFACVILNEKPETMGMIKKVRQFISYGSIKEEDLKKLVEFRARKAGNKPILKSEVDKVVSEIKEEKIITIKPFFALHPPIKGFRKSTKQMYPKGVLGENKEIIKLLERMI
jgi:large subunit ribosomal protein L30